MVHLRRLRPRAEHALEDQVTRLEVLELLDPPAGRHLARHLVGRAAAEDGGQRGGTGERLQLEDAPDEAGAVEAAGQLLPVPELLSRLGGAAPDVGRADEGDRALQDLALRVAQLRQDELLGRRANLILLPTREVEQPGQRVGGLGARRRIVEAELERVLGGGVVEAEPEEAGDRLGADTLLRREPRTAERARDGAGRVAEAEEADEGRVELPDRDSATR